MGRYRIALVALACAISMVSGVSPAADRPARAPAPATPAETTLLVAGDLLGPYGDALDPDDPRLAAVTRLVRSADAAFANQEGSSFDKATNAIAAAAENGGGYPIHSLPVLRGLKSMGFDLLSRANNHATDWGQDGLLASDRAVDAVGFVWAGTGASLAQARTPGRFVAPDGARFALVATSSTFPGMSPAGDAFRGSPPRPGLAPLHVMPVTGVTREEFASLVAIARRGGWQGRDLPDATSRELYLGETRFRIADAPGLSYDVAPADREAVLREIGEAAREGDEVLFSIHSHETASGGYEDPAPADFLPPLFHDAIDRGASVVARHGPHAVQGIEIYKGRPIFYGLGHFFFDLPQRLTIPSTGGPPQTVNFPADWWLGAVATVTMRGGALRQVRVYPLRIEAADGPRRGWPELATGATARKVLETIRDRSAHYGTRMRIVGNVGVIDG